MKATKFILFFLILFFMVSCEQVNTPITPSVIKTDSIKLDSIKLPIDTTKYDFILLKYEFMFTLNQNVICLGSPIYLNVQNNVTQDSINRFCYNYYNGKDYYYRQVISVTSSGDIVREIYTTKPLPIKLPCEKNDTILTKYSIYYGSVVNTTPYVFWLSGTTMGTCANLKLTKTSLDYICKILNKDTVIKIDTISFSLKLKYYSNKIQK